MGKDRVCLFFYVQGEFFIHGCSLEEAENYGDFLVYPDSHFEIWDKFYYEKYGVDFDFFPRGRIAYNKREKKFILYYDACIDEAIDKFVGANYEELPLVEHDEHYQCYKCNKSYVL